MFTKFCTFTGQPQKSCQSSKIHSTVVWEACEHTSQLALVADQTSACQCSVERYPSLMQSTGALNIPEI